MDSMADPITITDLGESGYTILEPIPVKVHYSVSVDIPLGGAELCWESVDKALEELKAIILDAYVEIAGMPDEKLGNWVIRERDWLKKHIRKDTR